MNQVSRYRLFLLLAFVCTCVQGEESGTSENPDASLRDRIIAGDRARARNALLHAGLELSDAKQITDRLIADIEVCYIEVSKRMDDEAGFGLSEGVVFFLQCRATAYERAGIPVPVEREGTIMSWTE